MGYTAQSGDTIVKAANPLGRPWKELKAANPKAVGRSRQNGNWFLRERMAVAAAAKKTRFTDALNAAKRRRGGVTENSGATAGGADKTVGQEIYHVVQARETIWGLATKTYGVDPDALRQFNGVDDPRRLQIGQVLRIPEHLSAFQPPPMDNTQVIADESEGDAGATTVSVAAATAATRSSWEETAGAVAARMVDKAVKVVASWYGQYHHGRAMANGEPFNMFAATIAHKDLPLGAKVRLENPETGERVIATVTDRGPYIQGRDIDLSYGVAKRLSLAKQGVGNLLMTIL